jgi:HPt (histidine-containing phosphotransfer) domain-containing protein
MSIDFGAFDTALFAAVGDDAALAAELRAAFVESADRQLSLMNRSRCDANWQYSALRLKGVAASFGSTELIDLADEAISGAPGDPVILRQLTQAIERIRRPEKR